jgi:uncharacterized protein YggL (DUF469 family)
VSRPAHRRRRFRKKHRVGEYTEYGFEVRAAIDPGRNDPFWDAFIGFADANVFEVGGGGPSGGVTIFVTRPGRRRSATEADRRLIEAWFRASPHVSTYHVGNLVDAWH